MPAPELPADGRQSDTALLVQRGACRLLRQFGFSMLTEFTLASGRRADIIALNEAGNLWIVEIKSSLEDFRSDLKWQEYRDFCDRLYFAIPQTMDPEIIPSEAGLIVADGFGADVLRHPEEHVIHGSRRRSLTLAFARVAASRLHGLYDPLANS
ncbi:MAG: MmcB family DNA repair protein [Alphaproteobacteria bacterium]|nr:MmcB family DNA repair protein [Alphaproteobacteria bacterium]